MNKTSKMDDPAVTMARLQALDRRYHLHPFTDPQALVQAPPFLMETAEGCYVSGQGIRLLDAMAGLGCVNIGYGRKEMVETAASAMEQLSYYHSFAAVTNPAAAALAGKLVSLMPEGLNRVFFANSGSEANETLIKLALMYWRRKGKPKKRVFITRDYSYHGSTIATSLLGGNDEMIADYGLDAHGEVARVVAPFWYRDGGDMDAETFGLHAARAIEQKIVELGADKVAAVIAEPIQGTLGAVMPPDSYWPEVERICRRHNVLLIADEVVTGLGRTGAWFAQQTYGFKADMMALAKGLSSGYFPISAAVISDEIADVVTAESAIMNHGFTTSAHPVGCAVALKNLDILERENLVDRVANDIGPYFATRLVELEKHPLVGEVRVRGLIAGIELTRNKQTREQYPVNFNLGGHVGHAAMIRGVIARPAGNAIVLCPPFIIKRGEVDYMVASMMDALNDTLALMKQQGIWP
ncbi:MAG: aminotransferase class III-fold pyridoxal phosphate-dependent enzyme [Alphaproteobacteria bacterium]|nr:MAG: aminotransferase class III-fold pyridoxal phosphate-dependent enzyme [Alphaproteobacteria bacterium]